MLKRRRARVEEFTIGWICALHIELVAAREALDEEFEQADAVAHFILGRIGSHNVVIGCLPSGVYGINAAAAVATEMRDRFPSVWTSLLVGIAGGVPSEKAVIRLGDVIISQPQGRNGGVIPYDSPKTTVGGQQDPNGFLCGPPTGLLRAVAILRSDASVGSKIRSLLLSFPHCTRFEPPTDPDVLFDPSYDHIGGDTCVQCLREKDKIIERAPRTSQDIAIHYGTIGSGNRVIKDGVSRDSLSKECGGVLCFEMEAAGVMNILPCLVVRGICDYADSHKNKQWQPFAAAAAAACAKEVLLLVPTTRQSYDGQSDDDQQAMGSSSLLREPDKLAHRSANHTTYQRLLESNESDSNSLYTGSNLSEQQKQHYLESLAFDQIDDRHATIRAAHARTCRWLLDRSEYQDWLAPEKLAEHHGFFWIKGKPATGKSTIMKFSLAATKKKMPNAVILKFFFSYRGEELEKTTLGMYRSLLFQIFQAIPSLQDVLALLPPTVSDDNGSYSWDTKTLQTLFEHVVDKIGQRSVICFIEALDECDEDQIREMIWFFEDLGGLAASCQSQFRICFSSRHYPHFTTESGIQLILEDQKGHEQDIAHYLHSELKIGRSKMVDDIKMEIRKKASGVFLWVVLVVKILNEEHNRGRIHAVRKRLNEIPDVLVNLFDHILTRDGQNFDGLILCLQWLLFAKRPLKPEELYHAIMVGIEPGSITTWDPEQTDQQSVQRFVVSCSKGLAEVTKVKAKTVQFIHESVRDYLMLSNVFEKLRANLAGGFAGLSNDNLKDCCHDYMRISVLQDSTLETSLESVTNTEAVSLRQNACQRFPFLEYAVRNLLYHADCAEQSGVEQTDFVQKFSHGNWVALSNFLERHKRRRYTEAVTPLHIFVNEDVSYLVRVELKRVQRVEIEGPSAQQSDGLQLADEELGRIDTYSHAPTSKAIATAVVDRDRIDLYLERTSLSHESESLALRTVWAHDPSLDRWLDSSPARFNSTSESTPGLTDGTTLVSNSVEGDLREQLQRVDLKSGDDKLHGLSKYGPSAHDEDLQSLYSLGEEISSQTSSERTPLGLLAEIRLAHLLAKDHNISRLCVEALTKMEKLRLRRNLRRLLKSYYQSLLSSTCSMLERNSVAILRHGRAQEHVAQKLLDIIQPEHENELQRIEHQVRVYGPRIEGWLEVVKGSTSMYEDLDEQIDKRAGQFPTEEDDSASDCSSEGETITDMPNISRLEFFFKAGLPFQRLLASMQIFLLPSTLLPLARILMTIPNRDIWFADAHTQTYSDTFKQYFETLSVSAWDWWPLSPCQRALPKGQIRIYWRCHCSTVLWHDVKEDAAEQFRSLLHLRGAYLEDCHLCLDLKNSSQVAYNTSNTVLNTIWAWYWSILSPTSHGQNSRPNAGPSSLANSANIQTTPANPTNATSTPLASPGSSRSTQPSNNVPFTNGQQANQLSISVATSSQLYVLYGVAASRPTLELAHLKAKQLSNDGKLFERLRVGHQQFQGWWRYWFSIWHLSHCDFVKFEKFRSNHVITRGPSLPDSLEYQYEPRHPHAEMPPISKHEFQVSLSTCAPNCRLGWLHNCLHPSTKSTALRRIPKKYDEWPIGADALDCEYAWGLEARVEFSALRVLLYNTIILLGPFGFWAYWQGRHPTDMQNAVVPATFVIGLITLFWTISGVIKVLGEPVKVS